MKEQDYIVKKFVRARSAEEAISRERDTPVSEVYMACDKPTATTNAIGFRVVEPEE